MRTYVRDFKGLPPPPLSWPPGLHPTSNYFLKKLPQKPGTQPLWQVYLVAISFTLNVSQMKKLCGNKKIPAPGIKIGWMANIGRCKKASKLLLFLRWEDEDGEKGPWTLWDWPKKLNGEVRGTRKRLWRAMKKTKNKWRDAGIEYPAVPLPMAGVDDGYDSEESEEELTESEREEGDEESGGDGEESGGDDDDD